MPKTSLSKKDVEQIVVKSIKPLAETVKLGFKQVNERFNKLEYQVKLVEMDVIIVKQDVKEMKEISSELFTKLDEFIGLYKKQEQEMLMMSFRVQTLEERVAKLEAA